MGGVCPPWDFQEEQGISMRKLRLPEVMADSIYNNLVAKLVMTGDSDVGKTCILSRYTDNTMPSYLSTVGIDFKTKTILFDDIPLKLQIWDTAGQERFHTLSVSYFRGAHGFILVYDITNSISFENTSLWMKDIKMKAGEEVEVVLLGNKSDREDEREVSKERGEKLAWEYGIPFFETSAKENINIENAFDLLSTTIYAKVICINPSECGELERTEEKLILYKLHLIEGQESVA